MVLGYWDMAASLVTTGAIDAEAFRAAYGEIVARRSRRALTLPTGSPKACMTADCRV